MTNVTICQYCNGSGWTGWHKPMAGLDGKIEMVFVPQRCSCVAGLRTYNEQVVAKLLDDK